MSEDPQGPSLEHAAGVLVHLAVVIAIGAVVCLVVLLVMRVCGLHWSWTAPTVLAAAPVWMADRFAAFAVAFATGPGHGDRRQVARRGPARGRRHRHPRPAGAEHR